MSEAVSPDTPLIGEPVSSRTGLRPPGWCTHRLTAACPRCDIGLHRLALLRAALDAARDELAGAVVETIELDRNSLSEIARAAGMSRATVHGLIDPDYRRRRNA